MSNVLVISSTNVWGGAETVMHDYLNDNYAHTIYVYTSDVETIVSGYGAAIPTNRLITSPYMRMLSIRKHPFKVLVNMLYNLFSINLIIKKHNIDVLYGNNTVDMIYAALYKRFFNHKIKTIAHVHDIISRGIYQKFIAANGNYIDKCIVPSTAAGKAIRNITNTFDIEVIYNGIPEYSLNDNPQMTRERYGMSSENKILLFVGRIDNIKRVDLFIDTVSVLRKRFSKEYRGLIVGKKTVGFEKHFECVKNADSEVFHYIEHIPRNVLITEIYPMVDALILTSDIDTLPTVILEAMSCGKLVFGRDVGGVSEIITDGIDGYILPSEGNPEKYAEIIHKTFTMCNLTGIQKNACQKVKDKFSLEYKKNRVNSIIEKIHGA